MLSLERFVRLRPWLFHLTAASNVSRIERLARLECASNLLEAAGQADAAWQRRREHLRVRIGNESIHIRDQAPLKERLLAPGSLDLSGVVRMLNDRVYFWPGTEAGPIFSGRSHFARYLNEDCRVLVVNTREVIGANAERLQWARCNSGSPGRAPQIRDGRTFLSPENFEDTPGAVIECVFQRFCDLANVGYRVAGVSEFLSPRP